MWYGHAETTMWKQPDLPDGFGERMLQLGLAQTYDGSGWCFVESSVSAGVKRSDRRLDLGLRNKLALSTAYSGEAWNPEYRLDLVCAARRPPPMAPEGIVEELRGKKFTSNADVEVVAGLYRSYFEGIRSTATRLQFAGLRWGDAEVVQLAAVLPQFTRVTRLDLMDNEIGPTGARALAPRVAHGPLRTLNLLCNRLDVKSATLLAAVAKHRGIALCGFTLDDTNVVLEGGSGFWSTRCLMPPDAILLASDLSQPSITGSLTNLSLTSNEEMGGDSKVHGLLMSLDGAKVLAAAIAANTSLTRLDISYTGLWHGSTGLQLIRDAWTETGRDRTNLIDRQCR